MRTATSPISAVLGWTRAHRRRHQRRTPWERLRASFRRLGLGGYTEAKTCAARGVVGSPQAATMRFDDGAANAKPHAGPVGLGSKEGIEDLFLLLWGQPHAAVRDGHHNFLVFLQLRPNCELACPIYVLHRFDAIDHEVHQHLLQLHTI